MPLHSLLVRTDPELWLFLPPHRRRARFEVRHDADASLAHVVQALGIPLTEVGMLGLDGVAVPATCIPGAGAVVEISPVVRPQSMDDASGFLLDVGLGTLARRLRILGVDAAYRNDADDDSLVRQAAEENRVLLTQDRGLLMRRAVRAGAHVRGSDPDDQLADVLDRFTPQLAPWTRCTLCNGELEPVPVEEVSDHLEAGTRSRYADFARCRSCRQVYWRGAHGRRLDAIVAAALSRHG